MGRRLTVLLLSTLLGWRAHSQTPANPPAFEVADIKPSEPSAPMSGKGRILPGGRIEIPGATVKNLIMFAYGVQEDMILGGPKWAGQARFDVVAKTPPNAATEMMRPMFQSLLAERFKLVIHREDQVRAAYVLTVGKRAPQFHEGDGGRQECNWSNLESGLRRRECHNLTMAELARQLPGWGGIGINLPVVDQTGLKGAYNFHFDVGMPSFATGGGEHGEERPSGALVDPGPTIFAALDQIGLKLDSRKVPIQVIVIDHVEPPR